MLYMRVMCVEGASCWLSGVEKLPGTWSLKLLREAIWSTQALLFHAMVSSGVVLGGGWARGVRPGVAPSRRGVPRLGSL